MSAILAMAPESELPKEAKAATTSDKLRDVLNAIIDRDGHVDLPVTKKREDGCPMHKAKACSHFDKNTAFRGQNGLYFLTINGTIHSPQLGEVPFEDWISRSHEKLQAGRPGDIAVPPGYYTRWN